MNLDIETRSIGGDPLVDDYVEGRETVAPFFPGPPHEIGTFRNRAAEVRRRFDAETLAGMADAVRPLGEEARARLARISAGEGFFVTTGQQPGLFGGPLYSVHKAATAIALARWLEAALEVPVLALFWIASDDHDWDEANHAHVLDPSNELHRLQLDGVAEPPRSMGRRVLGSSAESALGELHQLLPPSDFTPSILETLQGAYSADATVASAFADTMAAILDGAVLGLVDGQAPAVRSLGLPVLEQDLAATAAGETALAEQTRRLENAGYRSQVPVLPGASNVFHEDEAHGRERLVRDGRTWVLRGSGRRLSDAELRAVLADDPDRFSANVVLRPVVESHVFPTLAYVAGPGEVRYLAQTGLLFEARGIGMPVVYPRESVTLVEAKVAKVLRRFGLELESFRQPIHELVSALVREDVPEAVQGALSELRRSVQAGYQTLNEAAREVDPTLKGPVFGARNDALRALGEVEKKIRQHVKMKHETELEQIEKAAANLAPLGKPQERVLNVHQYLSRYGSELTDGLLEAVADAVAARMGAVAGRNRAVL